MMGRCGAEIDPSRRPTITKSMAPWRILVSLLFVQSIPWGGTTLAPFSASTTAFLLPNYHPSPTRASRTGPAISLAKDSRGVSDNDDDDIDILDDRSNHTASKTFFPVSPESAASGQPIQTAWDGPKYNLSLVIIDHYDSFTYNLYDYFAQILVEPPIVIAKDAYEGWDALPEHLRAVDGIVLSPGPGTPHEQPLLSHQAITSNPDTPILGVCLGHQLMALGYGARVGKAPVPIHGQDHWISQQTTDSSIAPATPSSSSSLFEGLPSSFRVVRYHSLAALEPSVENDDGYLFPDCLKVTARSKGDNVIQGLEHTDRPHYGVQFHPESIGTQHGMDLVENFCRIAAAHKLEHKEIPSEASHHEATDRLDRGGNEDFADPKEAPLPPRFRVVVHPFTADTENATPERVFEEFYGTEPYAVWLDSSSASSMARSASPAVELRGELDILAAPVSRKDILEYHRNQPGPDVLALVEQELFGDSRPASDEMALLEELPLGLGPDSLVFRRDENSSLPFQYRGGFLGYLGYEVRHDTKRHLLQMEGGRVSTENPSSGSASDVNDHSRSSNTPTAALFLARKSLVFHHATQTWYMVGLVEQDQDATETLEWMSATKSRILEMKVEDNPPGASTWEDMSSDAFPLASHPPPLAFTPNRPRSTYQEDIDKCHEFIRQGESYELCLTNQLEARVPKVVSSISSMGIENQLPSTWGLYKILRRRNPAPYSAYLQWNLDQQSLSSQRSSASSLAICCSSPERFMSVQRQQPNPGSPCILQAEAKPIKGTEARVIPAARRNELTPAEKREDERRARSLELSLKNRAENLMIVDLLRNDMSRVCQVGSVHVAKLMAIESFATVHQMVSTIRGTLEAGETTCVDLLRASFPGGSMTGAPKLRTMQLLEDLEEDVERGPYAGSLGYISVNGCMDMNIVIRSAVVTPNSPTDSEEESLRIRIGSGGAITALSESEDEYEEMMLKAKAVVQAVQRWASLRTGAILGEDETATASASRSNSTLFAEQS